MNTDTSGNALKYDIYLNQFIPIELLSNKIAHSRICLYNYFLAVKNISQNQYSIRLSDAMPEDAKISSVTRKRDLMNNIDSFQVVIDFTMPFNISGEIKLLEVEFFSYFPSYREDEANKSTKPNTIEISHNIISIDNCIDYLNPASVQVTRLPICHRHITADCD